MKKLFILFFIMLLVPLVSATINFNIGAGSYFSFTNGKLSDDWGNDSNGCTVVGTVTNTTTDCALGNCYDFADGNGNYLNCGAEIGTILGNSITDLTISLWYNADNVYARNGVLDFSLLNSAQGNCQSWLDNPAELYWNDGVVDCLSSGAILNSNTLTHLVLRYNSSYRAIFLNGTEVSNVATVTAYDLTSNFNIGARYNTNDNMDGTIDEVGIWSRALETEEIEALFYYGDGCNPVDNPTGCSPTPIYAINISLYSPENNSYTNVSDNNLYFNISISNESIGFNEVMLYIDNKYNKSNTSAVINNANSSFNNILFSYGEHTWRIETNDTYGYTNSSENFTLIIDTSQPLCVGLDNESVSINSTYTWDVGCSDDNFFSFNITCDNGFNYFQDNIEDSVWNFSNSTSIYDETLCFYQYCDGHTGKEIKIDVSGLKSSYYRIFDGSIRITSHNSLKKFKTKERFDRIEFEIETVTATDTMNFTITNNKPINIMNQLDYKGWIITGDYWIDFEEEMDDNHVSWYRVKRISSQEVRIDLKFDKTTKKFKFKSIGKLNCESGYQLFSVLDEDPLDDDEIREFETIPEALFWMFLTVLWIFFFLGSLMILNPISNKRIGLLFVAEVFIGVVVSIGWIKNYNVVIGGLILAVSLLTFTYHSMLE